MKKSILSKIFLKVVTTVFLVKRAPLLILYFVNSEALFLKKIFVVNINTTP